MVKARAEIQRAYRQRKKEQDGAEYLEREKKRVRKYYIPIAARSRKDQKERREKVRQYVKEHRERKCLQLKQNHAQQTEIVNAAENGISSRAKIMKIKFQSFHPKQRSRKRISRVTSKNWREIQKLKAENQTLKRSYSRVSKRYERLAKRTGRINSKDEQSKTDESNEMMSERNGDGSTPSTPRKRVAKDLVIAGLPPSKIPKTIKEKLLLTHAMSEEIKAARNSTGQKGKAVITRVLSGKIIKKYNLKSMLCKYTGISRNSLLKDSKKSTSMPEIRKLQKERDQLKRDVVQFLLKDENSRVLPGKNDKAKEGKSHVQKRVLNDSMKFYHLKFQAETQKKLSFATFCRMRPKSISLTRYILRHQCLCQKHQNMALTLKSMKSAGASVPLNPDEYIRNIDELGTPDTFTDRLADIVHHEQWKKVTLEDGKSRTKVVGTDVEKSEFIKAVSDQTHEFKKHVHRVKQQYIAIKDLKTSLPQDHVLVQMDFAENFSCYSADEVQSAYWNSKAVTLHPVVIYFKENSELKHKNYVFVSDDLGHNIGAVYAFLKKLIPEIKQTVRTTLRKIHYWTDSPSSQYRNKTAFYLVSYHQKLFKTDAEWNYFETGHGKGPCDGIGGTAKRMADLSIKQGKVSIQDAADFYEWGKKYHCSADYVYVTGQDCLDARQELDLITPILVSVKGTMQVHNVSSSFEGTVRTRITSCYCGTCIAGELHNDFSESTIIKRSSKQAIAGICEREQVHNDVHDSNTLTELPIANNFNNGQETAAQVAYRERDWVAVVYDNEWHIGQIIQVDEGDQDCLVSFLRRSACLGKSMITFKWPCPVDQIWVKFVSIIQKVKEPTPVGRSGRWYEIDKTELSKILQKVSSVGK